jgi:hypothetical protein
VWTIVILFLMVKKYMTMQSFEIEGSKSMDSTTNNNNNRRQKNQQQYQQHQLFNESPLVGTGQHIQLIKSSSVSDDVLLPTLHIEQQDEYYPTTPIATSLTISTKLSSGTPTKRSNSNNSKSITNSNGSSNNSNGHSISNKRQQQQLPLYQRLSGSNRNSTRRLKTDLSVQSSTMSLSSPSKSNFYNNNSNRRKNRTTSQSRSSSTISRICDCVRNILINNLTRSGLVGITTGALIALFKLSIELVRNDTYSGLLVDTIHFPKPLIPVLGGLVVGIIGNNSSNIVCFLCGPFPPGLKGIIQQTDKESKAIFFGDECNKSFSTLAFFRKTIAAIFTLGTGSSLGPGMYSI